MEILRRIYDLDVAPYARTRKEWISAAIGSAIGVGSAIFGGAQSEAAAKKAREERQKGYNRAYARSSSNATGQLNNSEQSAITMAKEDAQRYLQGNKGNVTGDITEHGRAVEAANERISNAERNAYASADARKSGADAQLNSMDIAMGNAEAGVEEERAMNTANVASQMGNSIGSAVSSVGSGVEKNKAEKANIQSEQADYSRVKDAMGGSISDVKGVSVKDAYLNDERNSSQSLSADMDRMVRLGNASKKVKL